MLIISLVICIYIFQINKFGIFKLYGNYRNINKCDVGKYNVGLMITRL